MKKVVNKIKKITKSNPSTQKPKQDLCNSNFINNSVTNDFIIYTSPSCSSCKKVQSWFKSNSIGFTEKNILKHNFETDEIKEIIKYSHSGFEEIISNRSKELKNNRHKIYNSRVDQIIEFIKENPTVLKRPIIIQQSKHRIQVGFKKEQIEIFLRKD
ncbi:Spx/MgsR family RNA polymerase-binding regulatory protein [Mycoplasma sp. SG1]|uniref:Spx/MgsR family RNA polymerase-binding regulatory protein n=1 Tax=Mycoplasma sp. SG1 TaxID=2810348 RepID=UPI0020249BAE|nr:Spx/MgsR family RNA polymerase-binding regulatory protein [Mycoplasma sp. SG1]URM52774.1 Spx/MgsR family RNA polymerase-binding regulatory protein [Mycoplasma sp. SG1]